MADVWTSLPSGLRHIVAAASMAALVVGLQALVTLDPQTVTDWHGWAVGLATRIVQVIASTVLSNVAAEST